MELIDEKSSVENVEPPKRNRVEVIASHAAKLACIYAIATSAEWSGSENVATAVGMLGGMIIGGLVVYDGLWSRLNHEQSNDN